MKFLLDTHTFIWWDSDPSKLSSRVISLCQDRKNILLLSVVSIWEIQIKHQLGKLKLGLSLATLVETHQHVNEVEVLPVMLEHVLELGLFVISRGNHEFQPMAPPHLGISSIKRSDVT